MKKESIGVDMDDVLNNLLDVWLERYNKDYNDNLKIAPTWDLAKYVKPECGDKIYDYLHEPNIFYNLELQKHAYSVMKWLYNKYDVYIVTAYVSDSCHDKTRWVQKNLPFFDINKIIFCNNKGLLNLDYLIDDGPHNIMAFKQKGIIFHSYRNQFLDCEQYPYRVYNWKDIKKIFKNYFAYR